MIGKGENRWRYEFSCRNCANVQHFGKDAYCVPMKDGRDPLHADDDFRVRCDEYHPAQMEMKAIKRDRDRCRDCVYFSYRDHIPQEDMRLWGQHLDGWCSKIFPRGYVGAGKPGGKVWSGKNRCFQFELKEEDADQLSIWP